MTTNVSSAFLPGLEGASEPGASWHLYALIDPCLGEPRLGNAWEQLGRKPIRLLHSDVPSALRPYLLSTSGLNVFQRQQFFESVIDHAKAEARSNVATGLARHRACCAVLATPLEPGELVMWLARAAVVVDATGATRLLRYWDPRVMQHLVSAVGPLDWSHVLPGLTANWWFVDAKGVLVEHKQLEAAGAAHGNRLRLQTTQQAWLEEVGDLNACFERANARTISSGDVWAELRECLSVAGGLGLRANDRIDFAAKRFVLGAPIERASQIHQMLDDMRQHEVSYTALQAEFEDSEWAQIAAQAKLETEI